MRMGQFGLTSDEFQFLGAVVAALIVVVAPLYFKTWGTAKRAREVHHEVISNGGVGDDNPTLKDYAMGAYAEAFRSAITAEEARSASRDNGTALAAHIGETRDQAIDWHDWRRRVQTYMDDHPREG